MASGGALLLDVIPVEKGHLSDCRILHDHATFGFSAPAGDLSVP